MPAVIRQEQMEAFRAAAVLGFEGRVVAHLRAVDPARAGLLSGDDLARVARAAITLGGAAGIDAQGPVAHLAQYVLIYGLDFGKSDETAWAAEILGETTLSATARLTVIDDRHLARSHP